MGIMNTFNEGLSIGTGTDIKDLTVSLSNTLSYTGEIQKQSVSIQGLTENTDYFVEDNEGLNAGSYTLLVNGMGNYKGIITKEWSISKVQGSVVPAENSIVIQDSPGTTYSVHLEKTGEATAVSSNTEACTVAIEGDDLVVTSVGNGEATITITVADSQNYYGATATVSATIQTYDPVLANNTPYQIQDAAQDGSAKTIWSVGDKTAVIPLSAGCGISAVNNMCAFIIGFDHNEALEGSGIHFQFGKLENGTDVALVDGYYATSSSSSYFSPNRSDTNSGAWSGSAMYQTTCPAFFNMLPANWKAVIQKTDKYSANGSKTDSATYVTATNAEIWLLAEWEVFGARTYANSYEKDKQQQYDYYKNGNSKIKYKHNSTSTACYWMTRSCYVANSYSFSAVGTGGTAYYDNYGNKGHGFAPGFRVA